MGDIMRKWGLLIIGTVLTLSLSVHAQLLDMMAGSVVQGQVAAQSAKGIKSALNMVQHNNLVAQLNLLIADIRTGTMGNYANLKKENFKYDFGSLDWDIGSINSDQFYIELKNLDKSSCNKLINTIHDAVTVKVNSFMKKDCDDLNNIQFIFN